MTAALGTFTSAATLLLASSTAIAPAPAAAATTNVIKIGVEGPMSGPQASTGIDMWRGASLMAATINSSGGLLGKQVKLVRLDDRAEPAAAVSTARHAISQHVAAVVGPYNSAVGLRNLGVYGRAHVLVVRLTSNRKTSNKGITLQPMDYQVAPFEAAAIEKMTGPQKVAIVYDTSAYTTGVASQLRTLLKGSGVEVVAAASFTSKETHFTDQLTKVKAANPTVVYYDAYDPQAEGLVEQAASLGVPGTCLVDGLAAQGPTFLATVPRALAQKCVFSGVPTAAQFPDAMAYTTAYQAKYHQAPGTWGVFAYDSLGVLAHEIGAVRTLKYSTVNRALFHVTTYPGATGATTIDPKTGDRKSPPLVMQTVNDSGEYVVSPVWAENGSLPALPAL
jgi:branched-chain amino acid transport system substrate-binding protein